MRLTNIVAVTLGMSVVIVVLSCPSWASCPGGLTQTNKWCGPYTVPMTGCLSGTNSNSTTTQCLNNGYLQVGFYTTAPSGSGGNPFQGIGASQIGSPSGNAAANGAIGKTVGSDQQYLQYADNVVQAFETTVAGGDGPLFAGSAGGTAAPQSINEPWDPVDSMHNATLGPDCNQDDQEFDAEYDRINSLFLLAGTSYITSGTEANHRDICIAISASSDLYNSSTNTSYWSSYAFDLTDGTNVTPAVFVPEHSSTYDRLDYPRFGTWNDGYYMTFDFLDEGDGSPYNIEGFAVCKLDQTDIVMGYAASSATCYAYLPTSVPPMVHTLLPADMESDTAYSSTKGEFFLATVNPGSDGSPCMTSVSACSSDKLAFWTWSDIVAEHSRQNVGVSTFYPGCYNTGHPNATECVPQPGTTVKIESSGDRLMSPLAYRYLSSCSVGTPLPNTYTPCEYMAVTQTVDEDPSGTGRTGIRYYTMVAPSGIQTAPTVIYQDDFADPGSALWYFMPSNAIDKNLNVAYTLTLSDGSSTGCGGNPCYPSIYSEAIDNSNSPGALTEVQAGGGSDESDSNWGPYVSTSIDPTDDLTFWSTGEYLSSNETSCCSWLTAIYSCQKGAGFCP